MDFIIDDVVNKTDFDLKVENEARTLSEDIPSGAGKENVDTHINNLRFTTRGNKPIVFTFREGHKAFPHDHLDVEVGHPQG